MADEVILAKAASVERAVARAREEFAAVGGDVARFTRDLTRLDAATLNVQRACETAIDLAQHVVHRRRLGIPGSARELFDALQAAALIDDSLAAAMKRMVGFRNIAVHEYRRLDPKIIAAIIARDLDDVLRFASSLMRAANDRA